VTSSETAQAPPPGPPRERQPGSFLKRAEVRDALAWMRLLIDPTDAAAVVRALARPPIELRQVDLARVIQLARRRKLDLVLGLTAAIESPQVPPEARERIQRFIALHRSAAAELDTVEPDVFLSRLVDRLGMRSRPLLAPEEAAEQHASLERLRALAVEFVAASPRSSTRDLARHLATVVPESHAGGGSDGDQEQGPAEDRLETTLRLLREEVLDSIARIGGRLSELRLDTDLDISHGVVRYLELLKLSALLQRPEGQELADALADVNARLLGATTPLQREIFQTSTLDDTLLDVDGDERARAQALVPREEHSLGPFLPRKGVGLALSASDIQTYRSCPLRYKFARVLRIPTEQTVHQRFGIVVHQVLERYHSEDSQTLAQMLDLLEVVWRRSALGESPSELELMGKARTALSAYHARLAAQRSEPVWFERAFAFRLGAHHLRGRVDRVDRLTDGSQAEYELIDYKTSRPKTAEQLSDDIQLSLYALAAREAWQLESSQQAYYYVLDDLKVPGLAGSERVQRELDVVAQLLGCFGA
jgi:RecB family exonuclease